ncbi:MAG: alpha/beta hydrolase [Betaproteobacteria bacterium]|nr:alpha/beta hydrolase [Betaproteobacteria bacterium]
MRQGRGLPHAYFEQMDRSRRLQGAMFDALGLGPVETPSRVVLSKPCVTLKAYGDNAAGPAALLVPAPIKRAYIWDLAPELSAVRRCLDGGLRVYLAQWEAPGEEQQQLGLDDYCERLPLACVEAIERETGERSVFVLAHSLGGTLATLFAALHPERVRGLALFASPIRFGPGIGIFGQLVSAVHGTREFLDRGGNFPGSFLSMVSYLAAPETFGWERQADWIASLADPGAMRSHLLVQRWTLDEMPLARRFCEEVVEWLLRENRFMGNRLEIGGAKARPEDVQAPLFCVADRRCKVVPPEAVVPFYERAAGDKRLLWYGGDTGVALQHVGMLVGESAHRSLWPDVLQWVGRVAGEKGG